jgi:hypothetical protein
MKNKVIWLTVGIVAVVLALDTYAAVTYLLRTVCGR